MTDVQTHSEELDLRDYLAVLRRRKVTIAAATGVMIAGAIVLSLLQTPQYRATAEVLIARQSAQDLVNDAPQQGGNANDEAQRIQTEVEVMRSRSVREAVQAELGYSPSVRISAKGATSVVSISATDTDPAQAAEEANTYAATAITIRRDATVAVLESAVEVLMVQVADVDEQLRQSEQAVTDLQEQLFEIPEGDPARDPIQQQIDVAIVERDTQRVTLQAQKSGYLTRLGQLQLSINGANADGGGQVVSEAVEPREPFAPDPIRNTLIALVFGLLLGAALAFLRDYLDDRIRSKDDLDLVTGGVDVLGLVPLVEDWKNRADAELVSVSAPASPAAEAYRSLRTSLQFVGIGRQVRIIQVTSSSASEGKTTTLSNLGVVLARAGHRVVLVDCDLRRPRLHRFFGLENRFGFSTAILGDEVSDVIQDVPDIPRLSVVASGPTPPNPSELLATRRSSALLDTLADHFDYVLVDCPPLLPVADAVILASYVDATLLVATVNTTTKRSLTRSLELIRQVDAPLVGLVLNGMEAQQAYAYTYGDAAYAYAAEDDRPRRGRFRRGSGGGSSSTGTEHDPEAAAAAPLPDDLDDDWDDPADDGYPDAHSG
ncbi:MAG TPA: polysaccharide biosynthesis tyrosine autokinase [Iamia sp.]